MPAPPEERCQLLQKFVPTRDAMSPLHCTTRSPADTDRLAAALAPLLDPGDILWLNGPLGAGKTRLVQGLAAAAGCTNAFVNSPTFVLVQEYDGPLPIFHVDAYRLRSSDEFLQLGGEELLESGGVTCIEWAERIADVLPAEALRITITVTGPTDRSYELTPEGRRWVHRVERLRAALAAYAAGLSGPND